jgi:hypothetical protein
MLPNVMDRGRRPRRPASVVKSFDSYGEERVQGDPRGPGSAPLIMQHLRNREK